MTQEYVTRAATDLQHNIWYIHGHIYARTFRPATPLGGACSCLPQITKGQRYVVPDHKECSRCSSGTVPCHRILVCVCVCVLVCVCVCVYGCVWGQRRAWDEVTYTLPQCYNHRQYHNQRGDSILYNVLTLFTQWAWSPGCPVRVWLRSCTQRENMSISCQFNHTHGQLENTETRERKRERKREQKLENTETR